jgi:tetratricopeptide (TPR) repeat protein
LDKLKEPIEAIPLLGLVNELSLSNQVCYLHPSFGYYFEYFYLESKGIAYDFKAYPLSVIPTPPLTPATIDFNQNFWSGMKEEFARLAKPISEKLPDAEYLGRVYSRALNYWGVQLQRNQRLNEARACFEDSQKLNADNVAAVANAKFNENLRSGRADTVQIEQSLLDKLQSYPTWVSFVQICGPVDEPSFCINLGRVFAEGGLYRQAAQEVIRAIALKPNNLDARFQLANVYLQGQRPDKTMEVIGEMRSQQDVRPLGLESKIELTRLEALASANPTNYQKAEQLLMDAHRKNPQYEQLLLTLAQIYLQSNQFTNALETLDKQLALTPKSINAMLLKSAIYIHIKAYDQALPLLDRVLDLDPKSLPALINRGIVHFNTGRLEEAKKDYEAILKQNEKNPDAYYRLGEIAKKRNNPSDEIKNYRLYLKYALAGAEEIKPVVERLKELNASP